MLDQRELACIALFPCFHGFAIHDAMHAPVADQSTTTSVLRMPVIGVQYEWYAAPKEKPDFITWLTSVAEPHVVLEGCEELLVLCGNEGWFARIRKARERRHIYVVCG